MSSPRVYIEALGLITPLGPGSAATGKALLLNRSAISPLDLFPLLQGDPLPVGQIKDPLPPSTLPRTHRLARLAAAQAMADCREPLDAVVLGTTTGGILTTEELLRAGETGKDGYRHHGLASVADDIAHRFDCRGPALAVSTACSSGAAALTLALRMLRRGRAKRVLAGGVDSLCRLTYFGFHSLQLVDRQGPRPLDRDRQGMAVAEGAAMLLLTTEKPAAPLAELLGAGLTCDAYHPAAPHPEGHGARSAMEEALGRAGLRPADIDYINLHGTGTLENDLAEAKAVSTLFTVPPPLSSIKGATGHSLAAAGAIEAVVSTLAIREGFLPANTGCSHPDPALGITPLSRPGQQTVRAVLSNSFGFGGNNGSLVITEAGGFPPAPAGRKVRQLAIHGLACITGAGDTAATLSRLGRGASVTGPLDIAAISKNLPPRLVRRLKRLPRLTLSLATAALQHAGPGDTPRAILMGTGWGALSETYDFLTRLADSGEQFPSPTDFIGSVHNAPAGQAAIMLKATGANITMSGGDLSFEQALLAADLIMENEEDSALLIGADEYHQHLSPLFDPSVSPETATAEGGGAFCLSRKAEGAVCLVRLASYGRGWQDESLERFIADLGGRARVKKSCGLILAGIPRILEREGEALLARFVELCGLTVPVVRYRELTGQFASASAVAAVTAASYVGAGAVPGQLVQGEDMVLENHQAILVLNIGDGLTAMEFHRP